MQKERKLPAEKRKANQQKHRDRQDLAAVADQSGSEDDAEVEVAGGVYDHESGLSDFGSDSEDEDMLHVDVDYCRSTSRDSGNDSADTNLQEIYCTRDDSHPDSEPGYDRLKRLVMLRYGNG